MAAATTQVTPQMIAAQTAAGVDPRLAQFSAQQRQFLAQMLAKTQDDTSNLRTPANLGLHLLAQGVEQYGLNRATTAQSQAQRQLAEALYPTDKAAQLRWLVDPSGMNAASAKAYEPMGVKQGETVVYGQGGPSYTAPVLRDDGGVFGNQTINGYTQTGARPMNYGEQTTLQSQQETARHNLEAEGIDKSKIPIELGMLNVALKNANTGAGQLGLGQSNSQQFAPPPGFIIGHPGAR